MNKSSFRTLETVAITMAVCIVAAGVVYWKSGSSNSAFAGDINIPKTYSDPLLIKLADFAISIIPLGAQSAEASTNKNVIKYINAYPNTDVVQTRTFYKVKEDIILKQPGHPDTFKYQIDLSNYDFTKDDQGNFVFYQKGHNGDAEYGRFTIPAPFLIDANGTKSSTTDVQSDLTEQGILTITPSKEWLAKVLYPVTLDPTVEIAVVNVHSHPQQGQNWVIDFKTHGTADLHITPNDQDTINDDQFTSLSCDGNTAQSQILANNVIFYPNWSCDGTSEVTFYTKTAGNHTMQFNFGGQITYAYNSTWLTGYSYRKSLALSRASGAVTNYQMKLTVYRSAGTDSGSSVYIGTKVLSNYNDLRFTTSDGTTLLNYWIESSDSNSATVWIKFDSIGTGATSFYLYYGNSGASAVSSGANTFVFFDDFTGTSLSGSWGVSSTNYSVSGGTLTMNTGAARTTTSVNLNSGYAAEARVNVPSLNSTGYGGTLEASSAVGGYTAASNTNSDSTVLYMRKSQGEGGDQRTVETYIATGNSASYDVASAIAEFTSTDNVYYVLGELFSSTGVTIQKDYTTTNSYNSTWAKNLVTLSLGWFNGVDTDMQDTVYDWVRIRQYKSTEPSFGTWGIEENSSSATHSPAIMKTAPTCTSTTAPTGGTITYTDSNGLNPRSSPAYAGGYTVHTFTTGGTFTPSKSGNVSVLVVAGGGGGGVLGGGGAGGMRTGNVTVTAGANTVTVGAGGAGHIYAGSSAFSGSNSSFGAISASGGGAGGESAKGTNGGSGGGSGGVGTNNGGSGNAGSYSPAEGYNGGNSSGAGDGYGPGGGGGGGSSEVGASASSANGARGGNGTSSSISGNSVTYAGGGGGGGRGYNSSTGGAGGSGGGGTGQGTNGVASSGTPNTGGGGGAESNWVDSAGSGGSGIVIIKYLTSDFTCAPSSSKVLFNTTPTNATGIDSYTKLLIHFDGASGVSSYTAETGQTLTFAGAGAQLSTSWKKFGPTSLHTDAGSASYITVPNSVDFNFGTGDFTIDFWVRPHVVNADQGIFTINGFNLALAVYNNQFYKEVNGSGASFGDTLIADTAYHVAWVRYGNSLKLYVNGVLKDTADVTGVSLGGNNFAIGYYSSTSHVLDGYLDEFRVSKGIARWKTDFTPPSSAYFRTLPVIFH